MGPKRVLDGARMPHGKGHFGGNTSVCLYLLAVHKLNIFLQGAAAIRPLAAITAAEVVVHIKLFFFNFQLCVLINADGGYVPLDVSEAVGLNLNLLTSLPCCHPACASLSVRPCPSLIALPPSWQIFME